MWANALGAEVYALSHSPDKKKDALKMGAKHFVDTSEEDWQKPYKFTFDFIVSTADALHKFNLVNRSSTLSCNALAKSDFSPTTSSPSR